MELDTVERLSVEEPGRSSLDAQRRRLGMSCMAVLLFAFCLTLATRENEFPFTYHPDEPSKAAQLLQGRRNFYHPLLLLSTTEYVTRIAV
ncbi:MAG TPA: hypothetical protein VK993_08515, partial [Chthoniobacterales bacterium]|nr:hypothetical protein [Chthoniobacterales bacterium]